MSSDSEKHLAAESALAYIEDGMVVGLGSGSTSLIFVRLLAERVNAGLRINGVPTSDETAKVAAQLGIPLAIPLRKTTPNYFPDSVFLICLLISRSSLLVLLTSFFASESNLFEAFSIS